MAETVTESDPVIKIEHLAKTFALGFFRKKVKAITDVNLEVNRGEIFGLLGPNGAGKTTTLKVLLGLLRPTAGKAELLGSAIGNVSVKKRLGYLPESPYFYEYLTGRELLRFTGQLFEIDSKTNSKRAGELIDRVGLNHAADRPLRRYSKGMLQRIGLAQALVNNPELVILDEPLTGLDPLGRKHVRELVASLREEGKTVVLSSHILSDVELLADRVAILVNGRTVDTGRLDRLVDAKVINTEILVQGAEPALIDAIGHLGHKVSRIGDQIQITIEGNTTIDTAIEIIRNNGGTILAINPRKESLEDVVVRKVAAAGASD